jgi:hypothetical protein
MGHEQPRVLARPPFPRLKTLQQQLAQASSTHPFLPALPPFGEEEEMAEFLLSYQAQLAEPAPAATQTVSMAVKMVQELSALVLCSAASSSGEAAPVTKALGFLLTMVLAL